MIEAVDWRDHDAFFATCNRLLRPEGKMALQAILVADRRFGRVRNSEDFVKRHIFPGSCIPSLDAITRATARTGDFWLTRYDEFPQHYAETLHRWHDRLQATADEARARGYDDGLLRLWEFYLCYCEAAFAERYVSLAQIVRYVIAPHIAKTLFAPLSSFYIWLVLGTSMASIFGVEELTGRAINISTTNFRTIEVFSVTALIYIAITILASALLALIGRYAFRVRAKIF